MSSRLFLLVVIGIAIMGAQETFAAMTFPTGCSTTAADYLMVDDCDDSDGTTLPNHVMDYYGNVTLNWTTIAGTTDILNNTCRVSGTGSKVKFNFTAFSGNVTMDYWVKKTGTHNHWNFLQRLDVYENQFQYGYPGGSNAIRYFSGASFTDTAATIEDRYYHFIVTANDANLYRFRANYSNGTGFIDSGEVSGRTGSTSGIITQFELWANDAGAEYMDNITLYRTETCPQAAVSDTTAPTSATNTTNFTSLRINETGTFNVTFSDETALSVCLFEFDDGSGILRNVSTVQMSGTSYNCASKQTMNNSAGRLIRWRFYGNDTSGNWNATTLWSWNITNTLPVIDTLQPGDTYRNDRNLSANFTLTDPDAQSMTCQLWIGTSNGIQRLNQTYSCGTGLSILNGTNMENGTTHQWFVKIIDQVDDVYSANRTYTVDTESPYVRTYTISTAGTSIYSNLRTNLTWTDQAYDSGQLYRVALVIRNSTNYAFFNFSTGNLTGTTYNWNNFTNLGLLVRDGRYFVDYNLSDAHTGKTIPNYQVFVDKGMGKLRWVTDTENDISVTALDNPIDTKTFKMIDKHTFNWDYPVAGRSHTYLLTATEKIEPLPWSEYPAHFISGSQWIDFKCANAKVESVTRITDFQYLVTVFSNDKNVYCSSLGGLNNRDETQNFTMDSTLPVVTVNCGSYNTTSSLLTFNATTVDENAGSLRFYHNATGTFAINRTQSYTNNTVVTINFTAGSSMRLLYGFVANDTADNEGQGSNNTVIFDGTGPVVTINEPNGTTSFTSNLINISFVYQVTDFLEVRNCTLFIDNRENQSTSQPAQATNTTFYNLFIPGTYRNELRCYDGLNNLGNSSVSITVTAPAAEGGGGGGGGRGGGSTYSPPSQITTVSERTVFEKIRDFFTNLPNTINGFYGKVVDLVTVKAQPLAAGEQPQDGQQPATPEQETSPGFKMLMLTVVSVILIAGIIALWMSGFLGAVVGFIINWVKNILGAVSFVASLSLFNLIMLLMGVVLIGIVFIALGYIRIRGG